MTSEELFAKTLLTYDKNVGPINSFYSKLPYVKDYDLCNWQPMRMYSGNIIKFYQYNLDKPVILVTDTEQDEEEILAALEAKLGKDSGEEETDDEISEESGEEEAGEE